MTMHNYRSLVAAGALACVLPCAVHAVDWPQYRGPNHDGTSTETILTAWPTNGLHEIWKQPMKDGFSSITVADGKAFTLVERDVDGVSTGGLRGTGRQFRQ